MADQTITLSDALDSVKGQQHRSAVYTLYNTAAATDAAVAAGNYATRMTTAEGEIADLYDIRRDTGVVQRGTGSVNQYIGAGVTSKLTGTWGNVLEFGDMTYDVSTDPDVTIASDGAGYYMVQVRGVFYMGGTTNYWHWYVFKNGADASNVSPYIKGSNSVQFLRWITFLNLAGGDVLDIRVKPNLANNIAAEYVTLTIKRLSDASL